MHTWGKFLNQYMKCILCIFLLLHPQGPPQMGQKVADKFSCKSIRARELIHMEIISGNDQITVSKILLKCLTVIRNMQIWKYFLNLVGMWELVGPVILIKKKKNSLPKGRKNPRVKGKNALYLLTQTVPCS